MSVAERRKPTWRPVVGNQLGGRTRTRSSGPRRRSRVGYLFVAGYVLLLAVVGIYPIGYAFNLALTTIGGALAGASNFAGSYSDFRFLPAFAHIAEFMAVWLTVLVVSVIGLSLVAHSLSRRLSATLRFLFYLPAAFAGSASVMLSLFMLQPGLSPWTFVLQALGLKTLGASLAPGDLPIVFALIAFWTGAGGWILVIHGALANIPSETLEAAALDGAGPLQTALRVKLPLIKKWIVYMLIVAFAGGTQLFVEPQLISQASRGNAAGIGSYGSWSPNQLATSMAFQTGNFNYAAAIALDLLVIALACAAILVFRTGLFRAE